MTKVGQKKATPAPVQEDAPSEFTDLATLRRHFKLSYATVTKCLTDAGLKPVHSQRVGKGVMAFYNKKAAFTIFEERAVERQKVLEEKGRKAAEQALKLRSTTASDTASPKMLSSALDAIKELTERVSLQQDVTTKQFDLLNLKADRLEKKQVNLDKDVLAAAVKTAMGDGLATVTSAIRRQREDADKEFNAQRLAVEAQFVKVTSQLDNLLQRVSALTDVVGALENTILAIHTAPEPQAPIAESNKSGEANQEQHFFQSSQGDKPEVPQDQSSASKDSGIVPAGSGKARRRNEQVLRGGEVQSKSAGTSHEGVEKPQSTGKAVANTQPKPRVLILGLHDNKVRHIASFKSKLDMTIFNPDEATTRMGKTPPKADYIIQMIDYISHTVSNKVDAGLESILISGGLSTLRRELNKIVKKHQTA